MKGKIKYIPSTDQYSRGMYLPNGKSVFAGDEVKYAQGYGRVIDEQGCLQVVWGKGMQVPMCNLDLNQVEVV